MVVMHPALEVRVCHCTKPIHHQLSGDANTVWHKRSAMPTDCVKLVFIRCSDRKPGLGGRRHQPRRYLCKPALFRYDGRCDRGMPRKGVPSIGFIFPFATMSRTLILSLRSHPRDSPAGIGERLSVDMPQCQLPRYQRIEGVKICEQTKGNGPMNVSTIEEMPIGYRAGPASLRTTMPKNEKNDHWALDNGNMWQSPRPRWRNGIRLD